jgi:glycogen debranching enzyme
MKKIWHCLYVISFVSGFQITLLAQSNISVALIIPDNYASIETRCAKQFLQNLPDVNGFYLNPEDMVNNPNILDQIDVFWIHSNDSACLSQIAKNKVIWSKINKAVENGKGLLLSNNAVQLLPILGLESHKPQTRTKTLKDKGYGRMAGFHAFRSHPIFKDLNQGVYCLKPTRDITLEVNGYFGDDSFPHRGKVIGVDWDYITLSEGNKVVWEYPSGKGKVLAVGGYILFSEDNINRHHLEKFTSNCLYYLNNSDEYRPIPAFYWNNAQTSIKSFRLKDTLHLKEKTYSHFLAETSSQPKVSKNANGQYYQVSGQRIVLMGKENGGIKEIWAHPFMAMYDYKVILQAPSPALPVYLDSLIPEITIRPGCIKRHYQLQNNSLNEIIVAHPEKGIATIHYEFEGDEKTHLYITYQSNFRLMWPYSEKASRILRYSKGNKNRFHIITDFTQDYVCLTGSQRIPHQTKAGHFNGFTFDEQARIIGHVTDEAIASCCYDYLLKSKDTLDFLIIAGSEGLQAALDNFSSTAKNSARLSSEHEKAMKNLYEYHLQIETPDTLFNEAWKWYLAGINSFYIETPQLGRSLVAGFNWTGTGWNGGHRIDGRPGYSWYFGRDSEWSALAILDYGDFEKAKDVLSMLSDYQDLNGKIFHELTTSGFVHYDAADATPLYIVLACRYLRHTGDTAFIRSIWPNLLQAYKFCKSTDTDYDHLIENTNVGHGWVEGGPLYGSHTSLYLASCWNEALIAMAEMASVMNEDSLAHECSKEAYIVNHLLNDSFYDTHEQSWRQGLMKDGTWHKLESVMPAVPALFGQMKEESLQTFIEKTSGNEYITNYGSRILSNLSPYYHPHAYHAGSVWPLFTGWHAMAAYKANAFETGFRLIMANMNIFRHWGYGYSEEVLNGDVYEPAGVCRHQCWSETMAIQPVAEGMLGFEPNALQNILRIAPALPPHWNSIHIHNLRFKESLIHFTMHTDDFKQSWQFNIHGNCSPQVIFAPYFPVGSRINSIAINGQSAHFEEVINERYTQIVIYFKLDNSTRIEINYEPGISIIPEINLPEPGDKADGLRIIQSYIVDSVYVIEIEAPQNTQHTIKIKTSGERQYLIDGGYLKSCKDRIIEIGVNFQDSEKPYVRKKIRLKI